MALKHHVKKVDELTSKITIQIKILLTSEIN